MDAISSLQEKRAFSIPYPVVLGCDAKIFLPLRRVWKSLSQKFVHRRRSVLTDSHTLIRTGAICFNKGFGNVA